MEDPWGTALALFQVWISVLLSLVMLPAMFGLSLGVTGVYIQILVQILEVSRHMLLFLAQCQIFV